jgi:ABC-type uncharacterized transport system ATPase subunit
MSFSAELHNVAKSYGRVQANAGVDLHVRANTIHALVGENGAGKSTAMKILFGMVEPDRGEVRFDAKTVTRSWNPEHAFAQGIGMVHQHFMLAETETVHDNLVLGAETTVLGVRRRKREADTLKTLMARTGLELPLEKKVSDLPISLQSRCEILKVLYRNARFLILDEPTAVLTPQEIENFLSTLRKLKEQGCTILIVTHKLKEVLAVADEITVMRAGRTVGTLRADQTNAQELSELMVGRRVQLPRIKTRTQQSTQSPALTIKLKHSGLSLDLHPGQITGIAGVEGNGQEELIQALLNPKDHGPIAYQLFGESAVQFNQAEVRSRPLAVIPADRHRDGLVLSFDLIENLRLGRRQLGKPLWQRIKFTSNEERALLKEFDVRPSTPETKASALSGGNQQKLIIARELGDLPSKSVILALHPTRGVDVGAIEFIHNRLLAAAEQGAAVLLISSELDELMALSHRIAVLYRNQIVQWFEGNHYDEHQIGFAMLAGVEKHG